jgi:Na+-translocating ferredoxin:NAD+ oxidoreductase RnfE subunit
MKYDVVIYELGVVLIIAASIYVGVALRKLAAIVKQNENIWILPVISAVVMVVALIMHAYTSFSLLPQLGEKIQMLSSEEVLMSSEKLNAVKASMDMIKDIILQLKAFSFTCFFVASLLLLISTGTYIKWISK